MSKLVLKVGKSYAIKGYTGKTEHDLRFKRGEIVEVDDNMTTKEHIRKSDDAEKMTDYLLKQKRQFKDNDEIIKRKVFEKIEDETAAVKKHSSSEKED